MNETSDIYDTYWFEYYHERSIGLWDIYEEN
jgi:hypothetical protein